ncbi:hypothetical protein H2200_012286 [Cladophialophora chaetospira]|uniref:AMP-dependent synthetase/ligase domain-containing protein n=1 Tax=Cladophialophora chaetospira TaxID=386627 RepID=A0AA39CCA9_9EURO|nr:hypothetical protein H2200_012286 [Cladophialophora chaetospira]
MTGEKLDPATFDRTDLTTRHEGPLVLPHDVLFHRLHFLALNSKTSAVKDASRRLDVDYRQLLTDVVAARNRIRSTIGQKTLQSMYHEEEISFVVIAHGYEFVVAFLAVLALGGIAVPTSIHITTEELNHMLRTSRASAIICSSDHVARASSALPARTMEEEYVLISMDGLINQTPIDPHTMTFSSGKTPDPNKPGLIVFTSGSTGPPKGAALRRYNLFVLSILHCWSKNIQPGYATLNMLPTHHVTGLLVNVLPVLVGGGCVEFTDPKFDAARIWDRIRLGGMNMLSAVPTIYVRLLQHWETVLVKLKPEMRESYQAAISSIEQFHCGSAALPVHISKKWTKLCRGRQIAERYGGTEFGNPFAHESTGSMVTDGFFKTGDVAEKHDRNYYIKGRKSIDILKSGGYKISALDVERQILEHPKIAEAIVVGVDDAEYGQRIAAAVVLREVGIWQNA